MSEDHDTETGEVTAGPRRLVPYMPPEIAEAVFKVRAGITQLGFDDRNQHGNYSFASVDKFYTALRPLETEAGIQRVLDEVEFDVRAGDSGKGWAFVKYEIWFVHRTGVMWGPLRRHIAMPVTGAQTVGAAESYINKAFCRGFYMVPTGEKDGDDGAARDDAPVTKGATRTAKPRPPAGFTAPVGATGPSIAPISAVSLMQTTGNGQVPPGISAFLDRNSYEIDPDDPAIGGWSPWQRYYLRVIQYMTIEQATKLAEDNAEHRVGFMKAVRPEVSKDMVDRIGRILAAKTSAAQEAPIMEEGDVGTALET